MEQFSVVKLMNQIPTEAAAYAFLEDLRWGNPAKPVCPHCGGEKAYFLQPKTGDSRKTRTGANSERRVWKCATCRRQFSVLTGTIFHGTKISVRTWILVVFEMCASKNGVSAREIERKYDLTPKSAWYMLHRIREAMKSGPLADMLYGTIVADETYMGGSEKNKAKSKRRARVETATEPTQIVPGERERIHAGPLKGKTAVLSLISTESGEVRSKVIPDVTGATLAKAIAQQVDLPNAVLHTDELKGYRTLRGQVIDHQTVNHKADEYVRHEAGTVVTTNHAEGYFSQLKRSIDGTHHHVSTVHLERYLAEFDYRYSTRKLSDTARMRRLMGQVEGRRLRYRGM